MRFTTKLLPSRSGNVGILTLNNGNSLNALTLDMIYCYQDVWKQWIQDNTLKAIIVKPNHDTTTNRKTKSFCSGGDVKQVYVSGLQELQQKKNVGQGIVGYDTSEFFRQEYYLNYMLQMTTMHKKYIHLPTISLWDGIVMGGGVGISIYHKYRIATEHTMFAMPETKIGFFPDIGSFYWMTQLMNPKKFTKSMAVYIALTGTRLYAHDLVQTGLATHYIPSNQLTKVEWELIEASTNPINHSGNDIAASILMSYHQPTLENDNNNNQKKSILIPNESVIHEIFNDVLEARHNTDSIGITMEIIFDRLYQKSQTGNQFCYDTLQTLQQMSPTSLKITLEGLYRGLYDIHTIEDDLKMEYRLSQHCISSNENDFYEGIRAALVDKDMKPIWKPSQLQDVSKEYIDKHFKEPIQNEWIIPNEMKNLFEDDKSTLTSNL